MCARDHAAAGLLRFRAAGLRTFFFFVPLAMLARAVPQTRDAQRPRLSGTAWRPQESVVRLHASTCRKEPHTAGWPVRPQLLRCLRLLLKVALPGLQYFGACWRFKACGRARLVQDIGSLMHQQCCKILATWPEGLNAEVYWCCVI